MVPALAKLALLPIRAKGKNRDTHAARSEGKHHRKGAVKEVGGEYLL